MRSGKYVVEFNISKVFPFQRPSMFLNISAIYVFAPFLVSKFADAIKLIKAVEAALHFLLHSSLYITVRNDIFQGFLVCKNAGVGCSHL